MQKVCIEIPDSWGETSIVAIKDYYILGNEKALKNYIDLIVCKKSDFLIEVDKKAAEKIEIFKKENEKLKSKINRLKQKDYKNRALKASLTETNKVINMLIKQ